MIIRLIDRISEFEFGHTSVVSYFLLIVLGAIAIGCLVLYWNLMDLLSIWMFKIASVSAALYIYGEYITKKNFAKKRD